MKANTIDVVEVMARAIAPPIFHGFDAETKERALNWDIHPDEDQAAMRVIANAALEALRSAGYVVVREDEVRKGPFAFPDIF